MNVNQAFDQLTAAVNAHAVATNNVPGNSMLDSFVVVAYWVPVEANGSAGYSVHFPTEQMPIHMVRGLLLVGQELVDDDEGAC